jgi:membrane-associated phospholipid phosphatase
MLARGSIAMTAFVAAGRRHLPRGWLDLGRQLAIWFGFLGLYQIARGIADRNPTRAFENGLGVINMEERVGDLFEVTLANLISGSHFLTFLASWTYWNSEFTVVGVTLLFVYLRRYAYFHRFRNWILFANTIGLVGYVLVPTAPPRMFPTFGFPDTLASFGGLNHGSGLVQLAANPYAAMPSLHAADALIVGLSMAIVCRRWWSKTLWLLWPACVWFAVMATGNHFWLDILAGIVVAALAAAVIYRKPLWRRLRQAPAPA